MECKHCNFIEKTFGEVLKQKDASNREYWLMTEVFVYLHGADYCMKTQKSNIKNKKCNDTAWNCIHKPGSELYCPSCDKWY